LGEKFPQVRIDVTETLNPFYISLIATLLRDSEAEVRTIDRFLPNPDIFCPSFSKFWQIVNKQEKFPKP
jgi:deoxyribodipyrimidine photo-lyase